MLFIKRAGFGGDGFDQFVAGHVVLRVDAHIYAHHCAAIKGKSHKNMQKGAA
jgi:hypothetical protein